MTEYLSEAWRAQFADLDLAREFFRNPRGPHSERLRRLLAIMRAAPMPGKPVVVEVSSEFVAVASLPRRLGEHLEQHGEPLPISDPDEVERRVFDLRWLALFDTMPR